MNRFFLSLFLFIGIYSNILATSFCQNELVGFPDQPVSYFLGAKLSKTNIQLGVFSRSAVIGDDSLILHSIFTADSHEITHFSEFIKDFLIYIKSFGITIEKACFGVPGPSQMGHKVVQSHHHNFVVDAQEMVDQGLFTQAYVLNDFELVGYGAVQESTFHTLNLGEILQQNGQLVLGVGGGVGSCLIIDDSPIPAGVCYANAALCPMSQDYQAYLEFFTKHVGGNCSWGKLLGAKGGLKLAYAFVCEQKGIIPNELTVQEIIENRIDIVLCQEAVSFFMKLYANLVRNSVLTFLSTVNRVVITNNIAIKYPELFDQAFLDEYFNCQNPILEKMLKAVPLVIGGNPHMHLYGAAQYCIDHAL